MLGSALRDNTVILFAIQPVLALFALLGVGVAVAAMALSFRVVVRRETAVRAANGQVVGLGVQILGAVPKLRVAHAEVNRRSVRLIALGAETAPAQHPLPLRLICRSLSGGRTSCDRGR